MFRNPIVTCQEYCPTGSSSIKLLGTFPKNKLYRIFLVKVGEVGGSNSYLYNDYIRRCKKKSISYDRGHNDSNTK